MPPPEPADFSQSLYVQLRRVAAAHLRRERGDHTLQATALVHEAFMRLQGQTLFSGGDRSAVLAIAARQMRQVLIDHARRRRRLKRGGGAVRVTLDSADVSANGPPLDLLDLADALERLMQLSARQAEVVTLRFIGGLTSDEAATTLNISTRTVESDWQFARAWLRRELGEAAGI